MINKVNYEKAINLIIAQGASHQALFAMCNDMCKRQRA
jgi:hypothetical protein